jgi:hypothetical protein
MLQEELVMAPGIWRLAECTYRSSWCEREPPVVMEASNNYYGGAHPPSRKHRTNPPCQGTCVLVHLQHRRCRMEPPFLILVHLDLLRYWFCTSLFMIRRVPIIELRPIPKQRFQIAL